MDIWIAVPKFFGLWLKFIYMQIYRPETGLLYCFSSRARAQRPARGSFHARPATVVDLAAGARGVQLAGTRCRPRRWPPAAPPARPHPLSAQRRTDEGSSLPPAGGYSGRIPPSRRPSESCRRQNRQE